MPDRDDRIDLRTVTVELADLVLEGLAIVFSYWRRVTRPHPY